VAENIAPESKLNICVSARPTCEVKFRSKARFKVACTAASDLEPIQHFRVWSVFNSAPLCLRSRRRIVIG